MSAPPPRGKVFRDPVHQLIKIDPSDKFLIELIDHRAVQRLRRIKQLGVSWLTYHGAEHSRFSHSMGVFHVAGRIIETLTRRYKGYQKIIDSLEENRKTILAAALLHDIGHAPFSHAMERLFKANADHEERTIRLVLDGKNGISDILKRGSVDPEKVRDILKKLHKDRYICDIVSSQLDADRMDYLLRDSLFSGVEYGRFDLEWLVNHLCVGLEPLSGESIDQVDPLRLCLDRKRGQFAAEQLMIGRFHMTMQVYFHAVTRGWEAQLLCLLRRAAELAVTYEESRQLRGMPDPLEGTPRALRNFLYKEGKIENDSFLELDDSVVMTAFHAWRTSCDKFLAEVSASLLDRAKYIEGGDRLFVCYELDRLEPQQVGKLQATLEMDGVKLPRHTWELDDINHWAPYKDFLRVVRVSKGKAKESNGTSAILLSDGALESTGEPVEFSSDLFKAMGSADISVVRLYAHYTINTVVKNELDKIYGEVY